MWCIKCYIFFFKRGKKGEEKMQNKKQCPKADTRTQKKSNVLCFLSWIAFGVQKLRTQHYKTRAGCQF